MRPIVGGIYRHYKGTPYKVLGIARHSETEEELVVYQDTTSPEKIWARPLSMFVEVDEFNGSRQPRFTFISSTVK